MSCARIERWVFRLQAYDFKVVYKSGKENIVDALSRMSVGDSVPFDDEKECYDQYVQATAATDICEVEELQVMTQKCTN